VTELSPVWICFLVWSSGLGSLSVLAPRNPFSLMRARPVDLEMMPKPVWSMRCSPQSRMGVIPYSLYSSPVSNSPGNLGMGERNPIVFSRRVIMAFSVRFCENVALGSTEILPMRSWKMSSWGELTVMPTICPSSSYQAGPRRFLAANSGSLASLGITCPTPCGSPPIPTEMPTLALGTTVR